MKCQNCKYWSKYYSNDCSKAEQKDLGTDITKEKSFWIESTDNYNQSILFTTKDFYCIGFEQK